MEDEMAGVARLLALNGALAEVIVSLLRYLEASLGPEATIGVALAKFEATPRPGL